jgi:hypothetical protein
MGAFPYGLSGWVDYDRDFLPALDEIERIDYFEERVRRVFIVPIKELYARTAAEANYSSMLIVGMTACCGIEALGRFSLGTPSSNGDRFRHFATNYLSPDLQTAFGPITRMEVLWSSFRNGIAHGFVVAHGGFEENGGAYFAVKDYAGYDVLQVSPTRLIADIETGFAKFIADLRADCPGGRFLTFDAEFTQVFIDGN